MLIIIISNQIKKEGEAKYIDDSPIPIIPDSKRGSNFIRQFLPYFMRTEFIDFIGCLVDFVIDFQMSIFDLPFFFDGDVQGSIELFQCLIRIEVYRKKGTFLE